MVTGRLSQKGPVDGFTAVRLEMVSLSNSLLRGELR